MAGLQIARWPDGNSYLEQDNLTVTMFVIILNVIRSENEQRQKSKVK